MAVFGLVWLSCNVNFPFNALSSMKKILSLLVLLLVSSTFVAAQCGGGNNGNGNGYGGNGGYGNNGNGNGGNVGNGNNNPWANTNWPQFVTNWLQNGGQIPFPLAVFVIHEARAWGQQNFGLNQGQMLQRYATGLLTIQFIAVSPPPASQSSTLTFRVLYDGVDIIVVIDDL